MATYDYWQAALRLTDGKRQLTRAEMTSLRISEDDVGCGFFRMRSGPRMPFTVPVAIWETTVSANEDPLILLTMNLALSGGEPSLPEDIWLHACKYPVHESAYRHRIKTGSWPDESPVPVTAEELSESEREFQ